MRNLAANIRYAIRQFRLSPIFTAATIITLALGIGGTTAIFALMDAIMLRSLPVSEPDRLYRVGDGYECCVEGGPQDRWGMFSYPLFERLKAETPEFEEVTAFQAGDCRSSVRRQWIDVAAPAKPGHADGPRAQIHGRSGSHREPGFRQALLQARGRPAGTALRYGFARECRERFALSVWCAMPNSRVSD
jgi:hypothetical protein